MAFLTISVALVLVFLVLIWWKYQKPANLPPGPPHIPFLGSVPWVRHLCFHQQLSEWSKKYGPVISFSVGNQFAVALNDHKSIHEALVDNPIAFAGRVDIVEFMEGGYSPTYPARGILMEDYSDSWRKYRSCSMQILRSLGYGKNSSEHKILDEIECVCKIIATNSDKSFNPKSLIAAGTGTMTCWLLYGQKFAYDDPDFVTLYESLPLITERFHAMMFEQAFPILRLSPWSLAKKNNYQKLCSKVNAFNYKRIQYYTENLDPDSEPDNFIEGFLKRKCENDAEANEIQDDFLPVVLNDFLGAGFDTTGVTIRWALLWMSLKGDIQKKVQQELDTVTVGDKSSIGLRYREALPYTEATIMEVQRLASIAPTSLPHRTMHDVNFRGFLIPKGTWVFPNLTAALHDPQTWKNPEVFDPTRFLGDDGKISRPQEWIPFSKGRRSCLAEQLARQILFIFFANIMRSFSITRPDNAPQLDMRGEDLFTIHPPAYEVIFKKRHI